MFRVENADFIADKLASELLPNQEFREVLKNSLEAVHRRMSAEHATKGGRIEFDVDWSLHAEFGRWYTSCSDNGDGMNRSELEKYTTTLAVRGAGQNQSIGGNQGMGLKISGPTRHKKGVLIRSMKSGEHTMVQVGWDGREYDLIPVGPNGELITSAKIDSFPPFVRKQGTGTVVTFLGSSDSENTFVPHGQPRGWLFRYLNRRFFRLSHDGIEVLVRVPTGDEDDWPHTPEEAGERMRGVGKSFNLTMVNGTGAVWDDAADKGGKDNRGVVDLPGSPEVPPARVHWWVLPRTGVDVSSRTMSPGSIAVLYQNELHDWKTSGPANSFFARLGVLFGKNRIAFAFEPLGTTVTSDFARAHVLIGGTQIFESDAWFVWAEQFKNMLPERIKETMAEEQARLESEDPDRIKRIRDRLKEIFQLLRPRRFRRKDKGIVRALGPEVTGPGIGDGDAVERSSDRNGTKVRRKEGASRGIGSVLSELMDNGASAVEVFASLPLDPRWVSEQEAEGFSIVNGNGIGLRDRAAAVAGTDGRTANILLLNREFRGYQAILAAVNEQMNPEGDDNKTAKIEALTREWVEQKMIESIQGLRQLENGKTWLTENYDQALSPAALTAVFMADRYHTLREVKRQIPALTTK